MRDKIFETSANLSVTDNSAIVQAKDAGSSVHIGWGAFFLLVLIICALAAVTVTVVKNKDDKGAPAGGKK
jgi:hypothetical protein